MTASIPLHSLYYIELLSVFVTLCGSTPRYARFAVPEKIFASVGCSLSFDRCTNSSSLFLSPTALASFPLRYLCIVYIILSCCLFLLLYAGLRPVMPGLRCSKKSSHPWDARFLSTAARTRPRCFCPRQRSASFPLRYLCTHGYEVLRYSRQCLKTPRGIL